MITLILILVIIVLFLLKKKIYKEGNIVLTDKSFTVTNDKQKNTFLISNLKNFNISVNDKEGSTTLLNLIKKSIMTDYILLSKRKNTIIKLKTYTVIVLAND